MPEMPLTQLPINFFEPYQLSTKKMPSYLTLSPHEATYLNSLYDKVMNNGLMPELKTLLTTLNNQTQTLIELNNQFLTKRDTSPSPNELKTAITSVTTQAKDREKTLNEIKRMHFLNIQKRLQQLPTHPHLSRLEIKIYEIESEDPAKLHYQDLHSLENEVFHVGRQVLESEISGVIGNLLNDKKSAAHISSHPLFHHPFIKHDPISLKLKMELDEIVNQFSSLEQNYHGIKATASLEDLTKQLQTLNAVYAKYQDKVNEIAKRRKLLESSDEQSLLQARDVLFDALHQKLAIFDSLESRLKIHAKDSRIAQATPILLKEINTILDILKHPVFQFEPSKTEAILQALQERLLYLFTQRPSNPLYGLFAPPTSPQPFTKLLSAGWPFGQPNKPPKTMVGTSTERQRQNIISASHIEANKLKQMNNNIESILQLVEQDLHVTAHPPSTSSSESSSATGTPVHSPSRNRSLSTVSHTSFTSDLSPFEASLSKFESLRTELMAKMSKADLSTYTEKLKGARLQHDRVTQLSEEEVSEGKQVDLNDKQSTQALLSKKQALSNAKDEYKKILTDLDSLLNRSLKKFNERLKAIANELREKTQAANTTIQQAISGLPPLTSPIVPLSPDLISEIETLHQEFAKAKLPLHDYEGQLHSTLALDSYEKKLQSIKTTLTQQTERKISQIVTETKNAFIKDLNRLKAFSESLPSTEDYKNQRLNLGSLPTNLVSLTKELETLTQRLTESLNKSNNIQSLKDSIKKIQEDLKEALIIKKQITYLQKVEEDPLHLATNKFLHSIYQEFATRASHPEKLKDPKTTALLDLQKAFTLINTSFYKRIENIIKNNERESEASDQLDDEWWLVNEEDDSNLTIDESLKKAFSDYHETIGRTLVAQSTRIQDLTQGYKKTLSMLPGIDISSRTAQRIKDQFTQLKMVYMKNKSPDLPPQKTPDARS